MKAMSGLSKNAREAVERLIGIARRDTGQSRKVASFLMAWWNAEECGGFDLTEVWGVHTPIAVDMLRVSALPAEYRQYPDALSYGKQFEAIVRAWRRQDAGQEETL
jgi:ribosomal protein L17